MLMEIQKRKIVSGYKNTLLMLKEPLINHK